MKSTKVHDLILLASVFTACLAFFAAPAAVAPGLEGWHQDVYVALEEARDKDAMILVDLYADWCGWCRTLEEKVF
ncbi:MAG: thioredoxin family protein, partial [Acidobacteriota bacterium]